MSDQNKPEQNPPQPPAKPKFREVHVACRGSQTCNGMKAEVVFEKPQEGGGKIVRYRCLSCRKTWHINY